jgi:hypothetical protein
MLAAQDEWVRIPTRAEGNTMTIAFMTTTSWIALGVAVVLGIAAVIVKMQKKD